MANPASAAAATVYGDQTLLFGLPAPFITLIPGMAVTELKPDGEVQFQSTAEGPASNVTALAVSNKLKYTGTGSGYLLDLTTFLGAKSFTLNGIFYIITKWGQAYNFKEFAKADFSFVAYDGIVATPGGNGG